MTNLNVTFAALADPTRRAILARLALGETTVGELARPFSVSQPAAHIGSRIAHRERASRQAPHLSPRRAGVVQRERMAGFLSPILEREF
jgi:DNA-binding transcriptional ArsR family regulator